MIFSHLRTNLKVIEQVVCYKILYQNPHSFVLFCFGWNVIQLLCMTLKCWEMSQRYLRISKIALFFHCQRLNRTDSKVFSNKAMISHYFNDTLTCSCQLILSSPTSRSGIPVRETVNRSLARD